MYPRYPLEPRGQVSRPNLTDYSYNPGHVNRMCLFLYGVCSNWPKELIYFVSKVAIFGYVFEGGLSKVDFFLLQIQFVKGFYCFLSQ